MLDNYPEGFDHSQLDGETRDQLKAICKVKTAQAAYKDCLRAVASIMRHYPALALKPDAMHFVGDAIGDMLHDTVEGELKELHEANIDIYAWPENHLKVCDDAYNYITMGIV